MSCPACDEAEAAGAESKRAKQLGDQKATDTFPPEFVRDKIRDRLLQLVNQKLEDRTVSADPHETPRARIIDLMEDLKAGLSVGEEKRRAGCEGRKPPKGSTRQRVTTKQRKVPARDS